MTSSIDSSAPPAKRRVSLLGGAPPEVSSLGLARAEAQGLGALAAAKRFAVTGLHMPLKTTVSLCGDCLTYVPAFVYEQGGRVLMAKACPRHGHGTAIVENDARFYFLSNKDRNGRVYAKERIFEIPEWSTRSSSSAGAATSSSCCDGGACEPAGQALGPGADQSANKTCTVLIEVTDACNLACPVCYSDAKGDKKLPLEAFKTYLSALVEQKGGLDSVQLTGGEALLHPEFWELFTFAVTHPRIKKVYLPTNGLLLRRGDMLERLARHKDKLMVLLQFDALSDAADESLRGATPGRARLLVLARLGELGIHTQLTMTLARGVNLDEVGDVVALALKHEHVKVVAMQPATYSGRYELDPSPTDRLTLSDIVKAIAKSGAARTKETDFVPIPCSHPACGFITLFARRFGLVANIARHVDLARAMDTVAYRTLLSTDELRGALRDSAPNVVRRAAVAIGEKLVRSTDVFTIAIKPFMDRHNYDQDRIESCCHHMLDTKGNLRSFCEYNALLRQTDPFTVPLGEPRPL